MELFKSIKSSGEGLYVITNGYHDDHSTLDEYNRGDCEYCTMRYLRNDYTPRVKFSFEKIADDGETSVYIYNDSEELSIHELEEYVQENFMGKHTTDDFEFYVLRIVS